MWGCGEEVFRGTGRFLGRLKICVDRFVGDEVCREVGRGTGKSVGGFREVDGGVERCMKFVAVQWGYRVVGGIR